MRINYNTERLPAVNCRGYSASFFFFFPFVFLIKHIIVDALFTNIHPSLQHSSRSLIHASLHVLFPPHVHPALSLSQCAQCSFLGFSQLNISEAELKLDLNCENVPDIVCKRIDSVDFQK